MRALRCAAIAVALWAGTILNVPASPAAASRSEQNVKSIRVAFNRFWYGVRMLDWRAMESSVHFPITAMTVRHSDRVFVYKSSAQFRVGFMGIRDSIRRGYRAELEMYHGDFEISDVRVFADNLNHANVQFRFRWGEKVPFHLVTSLRRYNGAWKVVFTQTPT